VRRGLSLALTSLLLAQPAARVDLTRIATIPVGFNDFYQIPVGDMNHDGRQELAFEQSVYPFSANIWEHWGSSSYQPVSVLRSTLKVGCGPVAVGDPDQDGLTDLLCQWGPNVFLLESTSPRSFPSRQVWDTQIGGFPGIRGYFTDTDGDGRQEMWIVPNDPDEIEVWENRGDDVYEEVAVLTYPTMNPAFLAFGDFDGDGQTEIAVACPENIVFVWETTGDDSWSLTWTYDFPQVWDNHFVASARDLDGDGKPEFLVGTEITDPAYEHAVTMFEATGDNSYAPVWELTGDTSFPNPRIEVGDVYGDGAEEFAVMIPGSIQLYRAVGDNAFELIDEVSYTDSVEGDVAMALADLNGDGADELIFDGEFAPHAGPPTRIYIEEVAGLQPPVVVPAWFPGAYRVPTGQQALRVQAELFNRTDATQTVDVWAETYQGKGQGGPKGPLLDRTLLLPQAPVPPGDGFTYKTSLPLPPSPGWYTFQLKVGTFPEQVIDTRWFTVEIRSGMGAGNQ